MATKAKKKAAPKKAAPKKKPAAKKATKRSKPKGPVNVVRNHRFAPGTEVGFHPAHEVTIERGMGREPMSAPAATATVKARGLLEVRGLSKGQWTASGPVGDTFLYTQFSVS